MTSLEQCRKDADVLLDKFRDDVSCDILGRFREHGVGLKELQKRIPVIYPWDPDYDRVRYNVNRRFVFFPL